MGRTQLSKALARELKERIEISEQRKKYLLDYLRKLQELYSKGKISYAQYIETIYHKRDGRTIKEWIEYYEHYIKDCERRLKKQKKRIITNYLVLGFFSVVLISIIISTLFYIRPVFLGFAIQEQEFTQTLDFETNQSTSYEWLIENQGILTSAKLSGMIKGEGEVKIYLEDLLILDSSKISKTGSLITGQIVSEEKDKESFLGKIFGFFGIAGRAVEESNITETETNESYSEEINEEEIPQTQEDSSPSHEESLSSSENITEIPEENITEEEIGELPEEVPKETEENITKEISMRQFKDICEETCDFSELNLNKSSYILRIEISDANLKLDEIKYEILPAEIPKEVPENITEIPEENITVPENITEIPENITEIITEENITITTQQYQVVIGQPVKWKKTITPEQIGIVKLRIPKESKNITIKKIKEGIEGKSSLITGQIVLKEGGENDSVIIRFFKNIFRRLTGQAVAEQLEEQEIDVEVDDSEAEYEIEYETPAPYALEEDIPKGKRVKIIGPETIHYENVLSFTELDENLNIINPNSVKIRWIEQDTYIPIQKIQDRDNNGVYDYIEWIAPILSEQTFEIIVITKAEHLDSNRDFISDIYDEVRELDDIWSETINENDYVRVTFEIPLDNTRDITLYPRVISGNPRIEVYEIDGTELIAEFTDIISNQYNKVYLTNLIKIQDVFDLRVVGGSLEIEHIIDPPGIERYFMRGHGGSGTMTDSLDSSMGAVGTTWTGTSATDYVTFIKKYTQETNITDEDLAYVGVWCNKTASIQGDQITMSILLYDCGDSSDCSTQQATICTFLTNIQCDYWEPAVYQESTCTVTNTTIEADNYLGVRFTAANINKASYPIFYYNNTIYPSFLNVTEEISTPSDTTYPTFSGYVDSPVNNTVYPAGSTTYQFNVSVADTNGTVGLDFDGTNYTATNYSSEPTMFNVSFVRDWSVGQHSYYWWARGSGFNNNFNASLNRSYVIVNATPEGELTIDTGLTRDWDGSVSTISYTESNTGGDDIVYKIYKNGVDVGTSNKEGSAGTYDYVLNTTGAGGQNYTSNSSMDTFTLQINPIASEINLTLDYNQSNISIPWGTTIDLNCTTITGEGSAYLAMYKDGTLINNGTSPIGNITTFNPVGKNNITCFYQGPQNYTTSSNEWWVEVNDTTAPNVTINTPIAQNYLTDSITFNVTALDNVGVENCSYSLSNGLFNYSLSNSSDAPQDWFHTNSSMMQGWINANFSCNDTSGNQNNTESLKFFIDSIFPTINITTPNNYTNTSVNTIDVKYTYVELFCDSVWYSNDTYSVNSSLGCGNNITGVTWSDAQHNVTIWINDTVNNVNYSIVTFTVDTTFPEINITTPINNTVVSTTTQDINYTYVEDNCDSVWYTNDTNEVNTTLENCGANITDITWNDGQHNVTIWINDTANNINSTYVNFSILGTAAPTITQVWNGSGAVTLNDGPSDTNLTFNFSVTDTNGIEDLVNESVTINISKSGLGRVNDTACAQYEANGNDANYTCNVTMWWWDSDGAWIINVSIKDTADLWASNDSTNITITMVTGFVAGPGNLSWATLDPGSTNQTPSGGTANWITLNNTGNQDIGYNTIQINATNLTGETTPALGIWAANFSVGNLTGAAKPECDSGNRTAQNMSASEFTVIAGAMLAAGNYTIDGTGNNVTGQEVLYFCIRKVGLELSEQRYSTSNEGAWTIKIALVALTYRRRKKKKKSAKDDKLLEALDLIVDKLKEEYSLDKEEIIKTVIEKLNKRYGVDRKELLKIMRAREDLIIPINIFSKEIGGLEAITKFMKENLNMSYSEIAKELGRDERTIWTAYKKAAEKQKELIKVKGTKIFLPISIFENKELTILESLVVYLRQRGVKYTEIAKLIDRDQRNVWTIYSRAIKKLKKI